MTSLLGMNVAKSQPCSSLESCSETIEHLPNLALLIAFEDALLLELCDQRLGHLDLSRCGSVGGDGWGDAEGSCWSATKRWLYC